jgi:hypothetical protein
MPKASMSSSMSSTMMKKKPAPKKSMTPIMVKSPMPPSEAK